MRQSQFTKLGHCSEQHFFIFKPIQHQNTMTEEWHRRCYHRDRRVPRPFQCRCTAPRFHLCTSTCHLFSDLLDNLQQALLDFNKTQFSCPYSVFFTPLSMNSMLSVLHQFQIQRDTKKDYLTDSMIPIKELLQNGSFPNRQQPTNDNLAALSHLLLGQHCGEKREHLILDTLK